MPLRVCTVTVISYNDTFSNPMTLVVNEYFQTFFSIFAFFNAIQYFG